ncbi:MAG TPA: hypothetical protein VII06_33845 [Chloroflexota bacterium]|jgi:uncharacterized protein (DUF433 family)
MTALNDDPAVLIARHVETANNTPDDPDAWLRDSGVSIWALVDYWYGVSFDTAETTRAYGLSPEAMAAALAYYRQHQAVIDARRLLNAV